MEEQSSIHSAAMDRSLRMIDKTVCKTHCTLLDRVVRAKTMTSVVTTTSVTVDDLILATCYDSLRRACPTSLWCERLTSRLTK